MRWPGAAVVAAATWFLAAVAPGPAPAQTPAAEPSPNGSAILAKVKAGLRLVERPPFVVYTLHRRDTLGGVPDLLNSYTLRIWCRTSDNAALSRRSFAGQTRGPAEFIVPEFDRPIDPGPPTDDLLDVIRQTQGAATPEPGSPPVIGSVSVTIETHYHVTYAGVDGADDHLRLEARRDPDRNRLTDLYVDRVRYTLHRAVAHDHLYTDGRTIPERFEIDFGTHAGVPVIVAIHGETDTTALDAASASEPLHTVDYRFEEVEFPPTLPAWYFDPAQYGAHRAEFPQ